jgi:photosystem II stability/assembly factor-like uncharacterized protein
MNKFLFSIFFLVIFHCFAGWEKVEGLNKDAWIKSVHFTDSLNGWIGGMIYTPPKIIGYLASSTDGGLTWRERVTDFQIHSINGVYFQSRDTGWTIGSYPEKGILIKTTDCGTTWKSLFEDSSFYGIQSFVFTKSKTCYLSFNGQYLIAKSTDYGETWNLLPSDLRYCDMHFLNEDTGWIAGGFGGATEGMISKTEDGGKTWDQKMPRDINYTRLPVLYTIFFIDKNNGWVGGDSCTIAATHDGGDNWHIQHKSQISDEDGISKMHFFNKSVGWAISYHGNVYYTIDGGEHWTVNNLGSNIQLSSIYFSDPRHGWIVGVDGTLFRTTDNGGHPLAVQQISRKIKSERLSMETIAAAPGNSIGLKYTIDFSGRTSLSLYDFSGKKVAATVNKWQDKGSHRIFFNTPPGAYLVRLSVQRGNEANCLSKKIVWAGN